MPERLRVGVLGAAWIAERAMLPALQAARNAEPVAIASRDPARAAEMAARHGVPVTHTSYDALLEDGDVDAVYIALVNSEHARWSIRALQAGKHVLCEKPLAMSAIEARSMAEAAAQARRTLMEGFMYRFHPRLRELRETVASPAFMHAAFSFRLDDAQNYRMRPELGGGALFDVGCYTLDAIRWFLGEPATVRAVMRGGGVDMTVSAALGYESGAQATAWASFEAPEHQELAIVRGEDVRRVTQPFTSWRDPHDPYQIMVEEFTGSILDGEAPPRSLADSIATAELIDRVRAAALK
jgi:xylose dehydrogenase (NAD/NADP)